MHNTPTNPSRQALPAVLVLLWLTAGWPGAPVPAVRAAGNEATESDSETIPLELSYNSIFTGYQRFRDEAISSWPAANDTVGRIGGWRSYLEESAEPDPSEAATPPSSPPALQPGETAQPTGHGGHP